MKKVFDKKTKANDFKINDLVLKWDARNEDKGIMENLITFGWDRTKLWLTMGTMISYCRS
jgi:hypothetical protein